MPSAGRPSKAAPAGVGPTGGVKIKWVNQIVRKVMGECLVVFAEGPTVKSIEKFPDAKG